MDLLDRLLGHDAWTTRQLLLQCRTLSDDQLDRPFDVDGRTLRGLFAHLIGNMEGWTALLTDPATAAEAELDDPRPTIDSLLARLASTARAFAARARELQQAGMLDATFIDVLASPPQALTYGGVITHLITHSMHHRAQAMYLMEQLGQTDHIEGDVLSWEAQAFGWNSR